MLENSQVAGVESLDLRPYQLNLIFCTCSASGLINVPDLWTVMPTVLSLSSPELNPHVGSVMQTCSFSRAEGIPLNNGKTLTSRVKAKGRSFFFITLLYEIYVFIQ